jgi:predicted house-cleaning NTP pyrophosphatase (Maf/HAM1 superfamily)
VLTAVAAAYWHGWDEQPQQPPPHTPTPVHLALSGSQVQMRVLHDAEIATYVASGEPMGKAGAYAIQGRAALWVAHLSGSYTGIMGLPAYETAQVLAQVGLDVWQATSTAHT